MLPFAPAAVVVRSTARVHLLSTWDEGVPPEITRQDLYGLSWNPANLMDSLASIPGLRESARVGIDGLTPMFAGLISQLTGSAELVDADSILAAARRIKMAEEITCLEVASAISESALGAMEDALWPGVTERDLLGVYYEQVARLGAPTAPSESVCFATPSRGPVWFRHLVSERPIGDGELVVLAPGALYTGYEAGLARTRVAGSRLRQGGRIWRRGALSAWTRCWAPAERATPGLTCIEPGGTPVIGSRRCRWLTGWGSVLNHRSSVWGVAATPCSTRAWC
ncbi:metallopeptidase M24 family protein [Mycobacterium kansasii]|uniref:Metallopeptidase M24 family protein n=1 Tax=Mycobacterium kansasii TaxID=1768 RepID=A0A1V3WXM3_MYCKA|nr:metallopeptidase M24 family protein [Mycobacterium kansasii]